MAKIGENLKHTLRGSHARDFDSLCENIVWQNVTNIAGAAATGSSGAYALSSAESGVVILGAAVGTAQASGNGFNVDLPTPARGLHYKFILRAPSIHNSDGAQITVTATSDGDTASNIAVGMVTVNEVPTNVVAAVDVLTFVKNKATCGDHATLVCDGTNWFVNAVGDAAGSVTLA
tara:strand:+ start:102 stop:629 length:528 start_codon:yes stop_codon:yes gene_type:complete